jgi:glycosyltransferase involved in cell wall biosynthesis
MKITSFALGLMATTAAAAVPTEAAAGVNIAVGVSVGTPVLANARSEVLVDHCQKSNAGLYYADRDEFVESLKLLVGDHRLRAAMGANGRAYVRKNYRWDVIIAKYEKMFTKLRAR